MCELKIISPLGENYKLGKNYKHSGYLQIYNEGRKDCLTDRRKDMLNGSHSLENNAAVEEAEQRRVHKCWLSVQFNQLSELEILQEKTKKSEAT